MHFMKSRLIHALRASLLRVRAFLSYIWRRFGALPRLGQAAVIAVLLLLVWGISALFNGGVQEAASASRAVTLRSIQELSGNVSGASVVGSVRARSEAELRAEAAGTVRRVASVVGASVPAGYVLAELENDAERAQVTQAEGSYDAAAAARAGVSSVDVQTAARNEYRDAFETLDTILETQVDTVFGDPTPAGPNLLINPIGADPTRLSRERKRLDSLMDVERATLAEATSANPEGLLIGIDTIARQIAAFTNELAQAVNATDSNASESQVEAIAAARTGATGVLSQITAAQAALRSGQSGATSAVDASVKSALGTLRLAEAALEKTRIRTPIGGTVNYLPIRVGDYVSTLDHVATVAQNGALEIVAFASEDAVAGIAAGDGALVEGLYPGTITSVAPALDPVTKQVEVHIAVGIESGLVNGQSVRVTLPGASSVATSTPSEGPALLPLSAVKLSAGNRVIFTLGEDSRLSAISVEIGEVVGERIEVLSPLSPELRIVTDARGLSDGEQVRVAESP
jgi:multidrug efflux pump subunit AcrA (membrane-fusion protein)